MARTGQRLALIGATIASFIGFLVYSPNMEGIAQPGLVRTLGALMKLTHVIVNIPILLFSCHFCSFDRVIQLKQLVFRLVQWLRDNCLVCLDY